MAAENTPASGAQANAAPGTPPQGKAATPPEGQGEDGKPTDAEAKLLKENMQLKKLLKGIESKQEEADKAALTEQGKFKELHAKAEAKASSLAQRAIKAELALHLPGLIKPDLLKLVDTGSLKIGDDGSIDGIEEVAAAFKAANPEYFRDAAGAPPAVPGTPKPGAASIGAPATLADWEKLPETSRMAWAEKNPVAFAALCEAQKALPYRIA